MECVSTSTQLNSTQNWVAPKHSEAAGKAFSSCLPPWYSKCNGIGKTGQRLATGDWPTLGYSVLPPLTDVGLNKNRLHDADSINKDAPRIIALCYSNPECGKWNECVNPVY